MLSDQVPELAPTVHDPATLVSHGDSPLLMLGSAGSGKTRLILSRFEWLVEQGTLPERIVMLLPSAARADAARAALEAELRDGYSELVVVTPVQLAAAVLRRSASRHDLLDATLSAGDRLAMLAERIDRAAAPAPRHRRQRRRAARRLRATDRPTQGRDDRCRRVRRSGRSSRRARASVSSPRSSRLTSGWCASSAPATRASWCGLRSGCSRITPRRASRSSTC